MTAVARDHRARGLGQAVKAHALTAAKGAGYRQVITNNDPDNAPMLAINRRMGFRDRPARVDLRLRLEIDPPGVGSSAHPRLESGAPARNMHT